MVKIFFARQWICRLCSAGLACLLSVFPAFAEESKILTLNEAISQTLEHNPRLYQFNFRQNSLVARRETSALSPALNVGLEVENFAGSGNTSGFDSAETTLALSSVIELGNKARSRVAVIDAGMDRLTFERQAVTLDLLGDLTSTYIRCMSTQENIQLAEEAFRLSKDLLETVHSRALRGAAPDAEVMRAKAALTRATIRLDMLRGTFSRQKVALAIFWGETNPDFVKLNGSLFEFGISEDFSALHKRAQNSPAIEIFASESRLREAEMNLARAQSRIDLGWQLGVRRLEDGNDTALVAGVSVPLFSGKRNQGNVRAAQAEFNAVEYQRTDRLLALYSRLFSAYSQRIENIEAFKHMQEQALPALEKALLLTRTAYENGRYRYLDWIVAQEELLAAKQMQIENATAAQLSQALIEQLIAEPLTH